MQRPPPHLEDLPRSDALPAGQSLRETTTRTTLVLALSILLMYPLDWVITKHWSVATLLVRAGWSSTLLLYLWLWRRMDARRGLTLTAINSALTSACFLALVYFTGGPDSPYMNIVPTLPLLMGLMLPADARPAISSGVTSSVGVMAMLLVMDQDVVQALAWGGMVGAATFFGMYGTTQFRKAQAAEDQALRERTRRESLEKRAMADRQRAQTEKLATVGRLAASVMHEINNPLAFVRSNLEFLRGEVLEQQLPEETRREMEEVFDETRTGVERIRQIVSDLKGFSRMDDEEPGECSLSDVVTDAARLAGLRLKNVAKLKVEIPAQLPEVYATRRRLAQVILNLLVNAGDALEEARVQGGEVRVTGLVEQGRVVLRVEDNGPGFPPEVLPRLFEAFFTTKDLEKGTGLGLAISREMVERFGGTLRAENRPEGGARLCLELPAHKPAPPC
jgi:signal transduction histidine kinase